MDHALPAAAGYTLHPSPSNGTRVTRLDAVLDVTQRPMNAAGRSDISSIYHPVCLRAAERCRTLTAREAHGIVAPPAAAATEAAVTAEASGPSEAAGASEASEGDSKGVADPDAE